MQAYTIPDIIGNNGVTQISAVNPAGNPTKARIIFWCSQGGQAAVGDANVGTSRGAHLTAAAQCVWPAPNVTDPNVTYDLTKLYAYVPNGTQLTITFLF